MEKTPHNLNADEVAQTFIHIMKEAYKACDEEWLIEEMDLDNMTTEDTLCWLLEMWCIDQDDENGQANSPIAFMYLNERNFFVHSQLND